MDLSVKLGNLLLKSPIILAGGITSNRMRIETISREIGAIVLGTYSFLPVEHKSPPLIADIGVGYLNAYGIRNTINQSKDLIKEVIRLARDNDVKVFISIMDGKTDYIVEAAKQAYSMECDAIELNLSAAVIPEFLSAGLELGEQMIESVRKAVRVPISVKLSPMANFNSKTASSADIVHMGNAISPALSINIDDLKPRLGSITGALSGPAIKPLSMARVFELYGVMQSIPIIGTGGIYGWEDIIEYISAGASATGIHTVLYRNGTEIVNKMIEGISIFLRDRGFTLSELKGAAHRMVKNHQIYRKQDQR